MEDFIQNNKLTILGKLTAGLLHEIRNPLTAIKLNLEYIKMFEEDLSSEVVESVTSSLAAFERINFIITDVLDFTKKVNDSKKDVSLNSITDRSLEILSVTLTKRRIKVDKNLNAALPYISFNENKLLQIFLNLINNAIEASTDNSVINIYSDKYRNGTDKIIWAVEDQGCGIKPEDKQKILEGFYTSKMQGNGIGLSICKSLLDEIGAELKFESEYGKGSRFYILFPLS
ncbi:MAG: HAMP domain-containing histidine kinase [Ignavibacteriales bacterium]|nr:HAMP domain-containing histidine kinase [Ignavibacteriales bacterium]